MQIGDKKPGVGVDTYVKKVGEPDVSQKSDSTGATAERDSVAISTQARELNKINGMLDSIPGVRAELVVKLKTEIESGKYKVNAGKVADKMIERAIRNSITSGAKSRK